MLVDCVQLGPGLGVQLVQVLPGLVLHAAPADGVGVVLAGQLHPQQVREQHLHVSPHRLHLGVDTG